MPVASPRRQPTSSSAHSGGAPSPSSSLSSSLLADRGSPPAPATAAPPSAWLPRPRFERRRSRFRRSSRTRLRRGVTGESGSEDEGSAASPERSGSRSLPAMAHHARVELGAELPVSHKTRGKYSEPATSRWIWGYSPRRISSAVGNGEAGRRRKVGGR